MANENKLVTLEELGVAFDEKVSKNGDTMTGDLTIKKSTPAIAFYDESNNYRGEIKYNVGSNNIRRARIIVQHSGNNYATQYNFPAYETDYNASVNVFTGAITVNLGSAQGTSSSVALSESIENFKFIQVRVGYYNSGFPNYGSLTIPVMMININSASTYDYLIPCYDDTAGWKTVKVGFTTATQAHITTNGIPNSYVRFTGIK